MLPIKVIARDLKQRFFAPLFVQGKRGEMIFLAGAYAEPRRALSNYLSEAEP